MKLKLPLKTIWDLLKESFEEWNNDNALRLGAALSYYTVFSMPAVLIIVIAVAGFLFGEDAARGRIVYEIQGLVGVSGAKGIEIMIENASKPSTGILATIIGFVVLIVGATSAFAELQDALNTVWEVKPRTGRSILEILRVRLFSFVMILGIGFLLLVSLVLSAMLTAFQSFIASYLSGEIYGYLLQVTNVVISFGIVTLLFAMMYKILPDVSISWGDVWLGGAVTSLLFTLGKFAIGFYLGSSDVGSAYGAAGSLAIILGWIYYSSIILFFGAEFTQVYARRFGTQIRPIRGAARFRIEMEEEQKDGTAKKIKPEEAEKYKSVK